MRRATPRLLEYPEDPESSLAAAILYPHTDVPYEELRGRVAGLPDDRNAPSSKKPSGGLIASTFPSAR